MASSAAPSDAAPVAAADGVAVNLSNMVDEPVNGSWVAELEDAKAALSIAFHRPRSQPPNAGAEPTEDSTAVVLREYLRLCRAYNTLRQWDKLLVVSKEGMEACASSFAFPRPSTARSGAVAAAANFRAYRKTAIAELTVQALSSQQKKCFPFYEMHRGFLLEQEVLPNCIAMLHVAVMLGDIRSMETIVALGAPIDLTFANPEAEDEQYLPVWPPFPLGATALLLACAVLAQSKSTSLESLYLTSTDDLDRIAECAMQLVRLGADPKLEMPRWVCPWLPSFERFTGKSAFLIAAMTGRRPLASLMFEHMQMSREDRAEIVHCRCGSRLPWKRCHKTGAGQPPHYVLPRGTSEITDTCYRVWPHALCPCGSIDKTYYKCCWSDNRAPVYLHDKLGALMTRTRVRPMHSLLRCLRELAADDPAAADVEYTLRQGRSWIRSSVGLFRSHPELFAALCEDAGPKSRMTAWDPDVYAGCLERLETPFLWTDVHWWHDRSVLHQLSDEWNEALHQYCDDLSLEGAERERVVSTHAANPCGPCGYSGCSAFEGTVREFGRCSGCHAVSYCRWECQEKDWTEHGKVCPASRRAQNISPVLNYW